MPVNVNEIIRRLNPAERKKVEDRAADEISLDLCVRIVQRLPSGGTGSLRPFPQLPPLSKIASGQLAGVEQQRRILFALPRIITRRLRRRDATEEAEGARRTA
jgi:hypothetical protein